ncbi:MAG: PQQ-binding-like beta-propeller repeat protein, partial [Thaumarchaeota archaeon]|nr:PQQ-binding-like beta-propeller repeat protein [Nitrososphaerota archaeon]
FMIGKSIILSVSVIAILVLSTIFVAIPAIPRASAQAQLPREERNWEYIFHDQQGTNFNPQKQITKDNVNLLELKWLYPFPTFIQGGNGWFSRGNPVMGGIAQGFATPPLVVDGIIYTASAMWDIFALDAGNGKLLWRYGPDLKLPCTNIPVNRDNQNCFVGPRHMHSITYHKGKIYMMSNLNGWGDIIVLDALNGKVVSHIPDYTKDIPGQRYPENGRYGYAHEWGPTIYEKGNLMIVQSATIDYNTRGFLRAYDLTTGKLAWSWYAAPPAPDCRWEPKQANDARKGNIDPALAVGDWGTRCDLNGAAGVWGHVSVDEETGRVYFGTSGPYPTWNATHRPGPNLYGNIIGALDAKTGDLIWYYQTTTRDIYGESDCKEGTMLMKGATVQGQKRNLVWNLCRHFNYILDADTGKLVYTYDRWQKEAQGANPRKDPQNGQNMGNEMNMKLKWWQEPKTIGFTPLFGGNGGYAGWDPQSNTLFFKSTASATAPAQILNVDFDGGKYDKTWALPIFSQGAIGDPTIAQKFPATSEIVALDLNTGRVKWKQDFGLVATRIHVTITGGMVCGGFSDALLRCWDVETGKDLWSKSFGTGAPINYPPTFAATQDGKMRLLQIYGGGGTGGGIPGSLMAFGLPDKLPEPQVITKEVVKEVIKEVPKEVIKEVPKEVIRTVTVETVSPISYAAIGIAVVLVVVAGVLFTRRKKA